MLMNRTAIVKQHQYRSLLTTGMVISYLKVSTALQPRLWSNAVSLLFEVVSIMLVLKAHWA